MPLVSTSIPNLINGISQQPAEIRMSSQAERQVNGLGSVARGLEKRPGTEHRARVSTTGETDLFIHSIRRDRNEEYTTILSRTSGGSKTLTAYDKNGVQVPVLHDTVSDASVSTIVDGSHASVVGNGDLGYLETGTTAGGVKDNIVATTVADTTFIINKTVKVEKANAAGEASGENEEGVNYTFTAATTDVITTSATHGLVNDDIVVLTTTGTLPAGLALSTNYYVLTTPAVNTLTLSATADGSAIDITGTGSGVHTLTSVGGWISSVGFTSRGGSEDLTATYPYEGIIYVKTGDYSSKYVVSIATIAAPTTFFKTGFQTPSSNAGVNQAYTATPRIAKIIKTGTSQVGGTVNAHGWDSFDSTAPVEGFGGWFPTANRDESGKVSGNAGYEGDTYYVSLDALCAATATGTNFAVSADASSSVIKVLSKVPFTIKCSDSSGGNDLVGFTTSVRSFSELPGVGVPDKYIVEIVGNADATQDNFYVRYDEEKKTWNESIGPSLTTGLNILTMPHRLVRLFDSQTPANIYFLYEPVKEVPTGLSSPRYGWTSRKSGNDTTNPFPTFVGGKINDICFHKNRFGILSDENIIFSTAGNYYNFFPISVMTSLATNPIDISVSNNEVSILKHAAAFDQSLLLFSDFQQFSLNSEGTTFSPSSVSVDVVTQFESTSKAPPVSSGKFVYFPFKRGEYSGVREYFVDLGASDSNDATDITAHVPQYIKGNITKMIVSSTDQIIAVLSDDDLKRVYIYKQFWDGQKKLQNSWSHWEFDGDILNCAFLGSTLQLITKRLNTDGSIDGIYLEDLNLSLDSAEAVMEDETSVLLDRRIKLTYNQTVASNLPYHGNIPNNMVYVTDNARKLTTVAQVNEYLADSTNTPTADIAVYAGIPYTFEYEFSRFIHKENDLPVQTAKLQVRNINLLYNKTGFFNVKVNVTPGTILIPDPDNAGQTISSTPRTNYSKNFSGMITNTSSLGQYKLLSGTFKSSVMTNSSNCNIILENNEYLPCAFQSAEWEGFLHKRSQRV
jgi:hypothetical protein